MDPNNELFPEMPPGPLDYYRKQARFCWKEMKLFIEDIEHLKIKKKVWDTLERDPAFERPIEQLDSNEMKRRAAVQLYKFLHYHFVGPETANLPYGKKTRLLMSINEALAVTFPDVSVKHAVGVSLFKNTLSSLGTERHKHVLDAVWKGQVVGCFALTEISHGSNTKQIRTTATYDEKTQEFIINTPDFEAAKCWVGNLGKTCTIGLVFAQLITKNQCHGLHAFLVPLRDPRTLVPYPGITLGDMGEKIGLNGIDNGFAIFKDFRIPREYMLNKTADVTPEGEYESSFSDPGRILGAALENLSTGRVGIMQESSNNLICAITIAIRYAALRKQFGPNGSSEGDSNPQEMPLIEYPLHQWRLFPHLAASLVLRIFVNNFTNDYLAGVELTTTSTHLQDLNEMVSEIHAVISSAKPIITWSARDAIQECREACGGHGFHKASRLGDLKTIVEPCVTYEGDNNVLIQQTSNWVIRQWQSLLKESKLSTPLGTCSFLKDYKTITSKKFQTSNILSEDFVAECYQWLIIYLIKESLNKQERIFKNGGCRFKAKNESQVFGAAVLSRAYIEFTALRYFWKKKALAPNNLKPVLEEVGALYALFCLDKHIVYFYQGGYTNDPNFARSIKDGILDLCKRLLPNSLALVDSLAPPDYVINSVLGRSDGKLYENLQNVLIHNPGSMSRPYWWQEIVHPNAPDFKKPIKSKL